MSTLATIPNDLDRPSLTYAIENPTDAVRKIDPLARVPGIERLVSLPGVTMAVEFVPALNPVATLQSAEIKLSVELPPPPGSGLGGQTVELSYSPSANLGPEGAWSLAVEQEIVDLNQFIPGPQIIGEETLAFKAKAAGLTTEMLALAVPAMVAAAGEVGQTGDPGAMTDTLSAIFRDVDNADFKVLLNSDIDRVHDAGARALGSAIQGGTTIVAELLTPAPGVDGAIGFGVGGAINSAINGIAIATETTLENGVSMPLYNLGDQLGPGREDAFVFLHDGGSGVELDVPGGSLLARVAGVMQERDLDADFPNLDERLVDVRPVETPLEFVKFAAHPAYNGGSEEVKYYVDERQLEVGTSVWDLAADSYVPRGSGTPEAAQLDLVARDRTPPELALAQKVTFVLDANGKIPSGVDVWPSAVVGEPYGNQESTMFLPGSTRTAVRLLDEAFAELRANAPAGTTAELGRYLSDAGAGRLGLNFGIPEIDAANRRVDADGRSLFAPTPEDEARAANFARAGGRAGTVEAIAKTHVLVRDNQVLAVPIPRPGDHLPPRSLRPGESASDALREIAEREGFASEPGRGTGLLVTDGRRTLEEPQRGVAAVPALVAESEEPSRPVPTAERGPAVSGPGALTETQSRDLAASLYTLADRLGVGHLLDEAARTGDDGTLRAAHPSGTLVADALVDIVESSGDGASVQAGISAARSASAEAPEPEAATKAVSTPDADRPTRPAAEPLAQGL